MTVKGINIWIRTYFVALNQNSVFQNNFTPHLAPSLFLLVSVIPLHLSLALSLRLLHLLPLLP